MRSDIDSYIDFRMRAAGYRGPNVFAPPALQAHRQSLARDSPGASTSSPTSRCSPPSPTARTRSTAKHARAAIRDSEFGRGRRGVPNAWWFVGAGLAAGLLVGVGLHLWNQSGATRGVAAAASQVPVETSVAATAPAPPGPGQDHSGAKANPDPESSPAAVTVSSAAPAAVAAALPSPPPESAAVAPSPATPVAASIGARPPAAGKLAQERFAATQKWLKTAPSGTWTIQLMTAGDSQTIERFLEEAAQTVRLEDVYLYGVKQNGRQYYGVTYGNYPTLEDTITAMGDLPTSFKSARSLPSQHRCHAPAEPGISSHPDPALGHKGFAPIKQFLRVFCYTGFSSPEGLRRQRARGVGGGMVKKLLVCGLGIALSGCFQPMKPSVGHMQDSATGPSAATIPPPVQAVPDPPKPKPTPRAETYSVVVNNVNVRELLFALARDAKVNVDIHPGITGAVTLNAIDQTLPQLLTRIAKQVDMRYELDGPNLLVMPDSPYLRIYKIDYVNMERVDARARSASRPRSSASRPAAAAAPAGAPPPAAAAPARTPRRVSVQNHSANQFWDTLVEERRGHPARDRQAPSRWRAGCAGRRGASGGGARTTRGGGAWRSRRSRRAQPAAWPSPRSGRART